MRRSWVAAALAAAVCMAGPLLASQAHAGSEAALLRLLIRKGILTREDVDALRREAEAEERARGPAPAQVATPPAATTGEPGQAPVTEAQLNEAVGQVRNEVLAEMAEKEEAAISISATVEGEVRWRRRGDLGDRGRGATSDLFLRSAEVALEFRPTDYVVGKLVLKSEWLGSDTTDTGAEADGAVGVDEATITLEQEEALPFYFVLGKRTQPFGAFYERLVTDPTTKDAYEVNQVGATVGYKNAALLGLDLSLTVYRQEEAIDHLFEAGLFDSTTVMRSTGAGLRDSSDNLTSVIGAVNVTPLTELVVGGGVLSETGDGSRNSTAGIWSAYTWGPLTAEAEFFVALSRERYFRQTTTTEDAVTGESSTATERLGRSFKEKILSFGLYYRPVEKVEVGLRYSRFWDDGLATSVGVWSVRNRISVGAGWTVYEKGDVSVTVSGEYRYSDLARGGDARQTAVPDQHELFGKVAVTYK